jgi:hypothetical protein
MTQHVIQIAHDKPLRQLMRCRTGLDNVNIFVILILFRRWPYWHPCLKMPYPSQDAKAPTKMQEFTYTPLGSTQSTRLIKILPGEAISSIKCHIFEINLHDLPISGYIALSYCWGSASKTKPITLNHYPFCITENLYTALQVLRESHVRTCFGSMEYV